MFNSLNNTHYNMLKTFKKALTTKALQRMIKKTYLSEYKSKLYMLKRFYIVKDSRDMGGRIIPLKVNGLLLPEIQPI